MPMRERTVRPNGSHAAKYAANIDALAWLGLSCTAMQSGRVVRVGILGGRGFKLRQPPPLPFPKF